MGLYNEKIKSKCQKRHIAVNQIYMFVREE